MNKIKVQIIDDSAVVRQVLQAILEQDAGIQVINAAADPIFAMTRQTVLRKNRLHASGKVRNRRSNDHRCQHDQQNERDRVPHNVCSRIRIAAVKATSKTSLRRHP